MVALRNFPRNGNLKTIGPALLYVNVKWCGYCKALHPTMQNVAGVLGTVVPVLSIDGDQRGDLTSALGVKSFPTLIYVNEAGAMYRYNGERTMDAITSFVCSNSLDRHEFCQRIR